MATFVAEAEKSISERIDVLEPQIYRSSARQVPKSPEWFMSASAKIKVTAKNMSRVALIAEEATKYLAKRYNLSRYLVKTSFSAIWTLLKSYEISKTNFGKCLKCFNLCFCRVRILVVYKRF